MLKNISLTESEERYVVYIGNIHTAAELSCVSSVFTSTVTIEEQLDFSI